MDFENLPSVQAGKAASKKLIEEHRLSGEPMVISPRPGLLQWVIPQQDGTMKVVKEQVIEEKPAAAKIAQHS